MRELSEKETAAFMADTDALLEKAIDVLISERGTPLVVVLDRMMTRVASLSILAYGEEHTANQIAACAVKIGNGDFKKAMDAVQTH